jgi:DNA-binding MarR family transcriptional regulator
VVVSRAITIEDNSMASSLDNQDISSNVVVGAISALIRAEHQHAAFLSQAMDLPAADTLALYHLANEPLSASALGDRLGLTSGSVTALIDRLVHKDMARRTNHPTDRRVVLVELTEHAHGESWQLLQHFIGDVTRASEELSATERVIVTRFLTHLTTLIDADTKRLRRS